ncbi:MAG TPA: hypothetical protein PKM25_10840, partial [Candidatus Ozemobacteraceae bacterium]|nr:hypothetical protein [Candidatus Ozemobacteraceae bacterium]
ESFTFRINLATGGIVSGDQGTTSILGTWKLEQESDDAVGMVPVRPNAAGGVSTVAFNADGTGRSVEYDREYRSEWGYALSAPTVSDTGDFTWSLTGTTLTTRSAYGTFTNTVQVIDGKLHQTLSDGSKAIWGK